jgi:hypothetical protein
VNLPPGLEAVKHNHPLFADYILGMVALGWGGFVFIFPGGLHEFPSYRWVTVDPRVMASVALAIGLLQIVATLFLVKVLRRAGALLGAALFINFAVNIFLTTKQAPGSAVDFFIGAGNLILFFWPYL